MKQQQKALLEPFALDNPEEHVFVARARDPTLHHHMGDRAMHVLQDASRVRDDYIARLHQFY